MSEERVKAFYEALSKDPALQKKAVDLGKSAEQKELLAGFIADFAKEEGFDFTAADILEFEKKYTAEPAVNAVSDWDLCFCALGGGGYNHTQDYSCACVLGGGGAKDKDGIGLVCVFSGQLM